MTDHGEEEEEEEEEVVPLPPKNSGRRGPDIQWVEVFRFEDEAAFEESEDKEELMQFTRQRQWATDYADCESFNCKFAKKAHFEKCGRKMKVEYLNSCKEVVVLHNNVMHNHVINYDYAGTAKKYSWTPAQNEIVLALARSRATATVIERELRRQEAMDGRGIYPTLGQINTKKRYMFDTIVMKNFVMVDTADLRIAIEERAEVPEDPHQAYIASYTIDDSDPHGKPRFTVTFSTRHLLSRINTTFMQMSSMWIFIYFK